MEDGESQKILFSAVRSYPPEVKQHINELQNLPAIKAIIYRLESELAPELVYHSVEHTLDVFSEAIYFALTDNLPKRQLELLAIAAAYHDAGYLVQSTDNESVGADLATEAMQNEGTFSDEEIDLVRLMIFDTKLIENGSAYHDRPRSELSRYLLDADLSNLGRRDFRQKTNLLSEETGMIGRKQLESAYALLKNHTWLTPAGKTLRGDQKDHNVARLEKELSDGSN